MQSSSVLWAAIVFALLLGVLDTIQVNSEPVASSSVFDCLQQCCKKVDGWLRGLHRNQKLDTRRAIKTRSSCSLVSRLSPCKLQASKRMAGPGNKAKGGEGSEAIKVWTVNSLDQVDWV